MFLGGKGVVVEAESQFFKLSGCHDSLFEILEGSSSLRITVNISGMVKMIVVASFTSS